jgi:hypothetical protein
MTTASLVGITPKIIRGLWLNCRVSILDSMFEWLVYCYAPSGGLGLVLPIAIILNQFSAAFKTATKKPFFELKPIEDCPPGQRPDRIRSFSVRVGEVLCDRHRPI